MCVRFCNMDKLGKLNEESVKRKERLQKLREQRENSQKNNTEGGEKLPKPIFRSYKPQNENTVGEVLEQKPTGNIEEAVASQLQLLNEPTVVDEIDLATLAPRKLDWDLKRDVAKKLEYLDRRTQKAIAELIRERLKKNQIEEDLSIAVNLGTASIPTTTTDIKEQI